MYCCINSNLYHKWSIVFKNVEFIFSLNPDVIVNIFLSYSSVTTRIMSEQLLIPRSYTVYLFFTTFCSTTTAFAWYRQSMRLQTIHRTQNANAETQIWHGWGYKNRNRRRSWRLYRKKIILTAMRAEKVLFMGITLKVIKSMWKNKLII